MGIMSLREVMDGAVDILRKYIKTTLMLTFGYGALGIGAAIIFILIGSIAAAIIFSLLKSKILLIIMVSVLVALVFAFFLSINVGMIKIVNQEFSGEKVLAHNVIGESIKSIFKVLGILVCALILFIPVITAFAGIVYLLVKGFKGSLIQLGIYRGKEILLIIFSIIVMIAAVVVILGYITLLSFSFHAMTIEKKGVIGSIKRSFYLVKDDFWRIFGCTLLFSFTIYAIRGSLESFCGVIAGFVFLILNALNAGQDFKAFITMVISIVNWPISLISWLIITPISMNMVSLLYFNQRFKKEGYDLVLKVRELKKIQERKEAGELV
jgi:hypothetical protein